VIVLDDVAKLETEVERDPMPEEGDKLLDDVREGFVESLLLDEKLLLVVFTVALQTSSMQEVANKVMRMSNCIALCLKVGHIPIVSKKGRTSDKKTTPKAKEAHLRAIHHCTLLNRTCKKQIQQQQKRSGGIIVHRKSACNNIPQAHERSIFLAHKSQNPLAHDHDDDDDDDDDDGDDDGDDDHRNISTHIAGAVSDSADASGERGCKNE
jgi:hypothetical protein